jgi:hypothetical protein
VEAIMLILKHATFLRFSDTSRHSVLTIAEQNYQQANMDLKIQQHLAEPSEDSEEHSVEKLAEFILATDIGLFILTSFKIISYQDF